MKKLIAAMPILYRGRMYQTGDRLPGDDANMVEAWMRNKSAKWDGAEDQEPPQDGRKAEGVSQDQEPENGAQNEPEPTGEGENEGGGTISGHLDPKDLEDMKKADLERLAKDMGLDISQDKTKADLIATITAAEVYAPTEDKTGGAQ